MRQAERNISLLLASLPATLGLLAVASMLYMLWWVVAPSGMVAEPAGIVADASEFAQKTGVISTLSGVMMALISCIMLWMLNRWYFITHSSSKIYIGIYALGVASVPSLCVGLSSGVVMGMTLIFCVLMLYSIYQRRTGTRRVFLVFFIIAAGSIYDYAYAGYVLPLLLGCGQMRCLSLRSVIAAAMGIVTPFWIGLGFGWISLSELTAPALTFPTAESIAMYAPAMRVLVAGMWIITGVLTVVNTATIYGHNAKIRANNGVLALMSVWTVVAIPVDFAHIMSYLPILMALAAVQTALCFSLRRKNRGYLAPAMCILLLLSCVVWQLFTV